MSRSVPAQHTCMRSLQRRIVAGERSAATGYVLTIVHRVPGEVEELVGRCGCGLEDLVEEEEPHDEGGQGQGPHGPSDGHYGWWRLDVGAEVNVGGGWDSKRWRAFALRFGSWSRERCSRLQRAGRRRRSARSGFWLLSRPEWDARLDGEIDRKARERGFDRCACSPGACGKLRRSALLVLVVRIERPSLPGQTRCIEARRDRGAKNLRGDWRVAWIGGVAGMTGLAVGSDASNGS